VRDDLSEVRAAIGEGDNEMRNRMGHSFKPSHLLAVASLSIFVAELLVMLVLPLLPPLGRGSQALLDSAVLVAMIFPALYFLSFRPMVSQLGECQLAEQKLEQSNTQVHLLSKRLLEALEEERKRISRELHDELGQYLTSIKMEADILQRYAEANDPRTQAVADSIQAKLDEALDTILRISFALRPSMLDDFGLVPAIESYLENFQEATGIACEWECGAEAVGVLPEVTTAVYRVLQEALTNVARHAATPGVEVRLSQEGEMLVLVVQDDGRGFDISTTGNDHSLGLIGMRERAELAGGILQIASRKGSGTRIEMAVPCKSGEIRMEHGKDSAC
jgi:signal transduction histidine kinase